MNVNVDYENLKVVSAFLADDVVWAEIADQGRMAYFSISKEDLYDENYLKADDMADSQNEYETMLRDAIKQFLVNIHPNHKDGQLNITGMHHITEANPATRFLFEQVYESSNGMFLVEPTSFAIYENYHIDPWNTIGVSKEEFERQIDEDILRFHLADCIEKKVGDALYTCYGSLSSAFTIDEKRRELKYDYIPETANNIDLESLKVVSAYEDDEIVWAEVAEQGRMAYFSIHKEELGEPLPDYRLPNNEYQQQLVASVTKYFDKNGVDIVSLPHITDANPATRQLYKEVYESGDSMFFMEHDDDDIEDPSVKAEFIRQVDEDISRFHLEDVIEKNAEGCLYVCYGNLASSFSVDEQGKELSQCKFEDLSNKKQHKEKAPAVR